MISIKRKFKNETITDLQKMTIEEQKKAVRSGYDMDIIPSDLATYGNEAKKILQDLQSRNERMFLMTFLVLNTANNKQQLSNNVFQASSIAQKYNCQLTSDLVVFYVEHEYGGTWQTMKYAVNQKKKIINLVTK